MQHAYRATFSARLLATDVWNRYGDALAEEPERADEYLVVSDAYEVIDLANHGDQTKQDAAAAASAAETTLRALLVDLEVGDAPRHGGGMIRRTTVDLKERLAVRASRRARGHQ